MSASAVARHSVQRSMAQLTDKRSTGGEVVVGSLAHCGRLFLSPVVTCVYSPTRLAVPTELSASFLVIVQLQSNGFSLASGNCDVHY